MADRNVIINIQDVIPKANTAYVDPNVDNKTYNKEQINLKISDSQEGIKQTAITPNTALATLNSLENGIYRASGAGTYKFSPSIVIVDGQSNNIIPDGWDVKFVKSSSGWARHTVLKLPSVDVSGDVALNQITKAVNGDKVFKHTTQKAFTTFDPDILTLLGGYNLYTIVYHLGKMYISTKAANMSTPGTNTDWNEIKFSAEVDQVFNKDSNNPIANKEVSKLANTLDGLYNIELNSAENLAYTVKENFNSSINGISVISGSNVLRGNNTITTASGFVSLIYLNVPVNYNGYKIGKFNFNSVRVGGALNANANLLGVKENGEIDTLIGSITNPPSGNIETLTFDLSGYKSFSFMLGISTAIPNNNSQREVKLFKKEFVTTNVKDRYDTALRSFMNPLELRSVLRVNQTFNLPINNVAPLIGGNVLNGTNLTSVNNGVNTLIYRNIPIVFNETKISTFVFNASVIGGSLNANVNLLGVKENGEIDILIGSITNTPSGDIENLIFDLKDYQFFSFMLSFASTATNNDLKYADISFNNILKESKEDSVKKYIDEKTQSISDVDSRIIADTLVCIDKSNTLPILNVIGALPTDSSDIRTPTNVELEYIVNNRTIFKCKSSLAVQGNATATLPKKGFECALSNYEDEELKLQFGNWIACSEFHIKAFPNDQTMTKDVASSKLWYQIRKSRPFPGSYIADFNEGQQEDKHKENLLHQALFYADGFPIELRVNNVFYGLYVFRLKKDRDNYMLNNANQNHIFLDNETAVDWTVFKHENWKVRSPKLSGYSDGGVINNPDLMTKLNRWWAWFAGIANNTIDFEATASQYINIDSWVDWLICQQTTAHWDSQINNVLMTSWDGQKLSLVWYDGDQTFGWVTATNANVTIDSNGLYWRGTFFRNVLYPKLRNRINARYTELRNKGIISTDNIVNIVTDVASMIPRDVYTKEFNRWSINSGNVGKHNLRYIFNWTNQRIARLDTIWKV